MTSDHAARATCAVREEAWARGVAASAASHPSFLHVMYFEVGTSCLIPERR